MFCFIIPSAKTAKATFEDSAGELSSQECKELMAELKNKNFLIWSLPCAIPTVSNLKIQIFVYRPYISSRKKQSFHNERIVLKDNGGVIREKKKVAEVLAEYFSSFQHPDFNQLPPKSYQTIKAHQSRPFTLTNTSPGEVKRIMKNIKTNKATGHNQIPARAVKESAEILCQPFSCLVNFLFERGKVPSSWKLGEIVPFHKKDCTLTKTNYRPITILPVLSKVYEKLVHSRHASHFEDVYHNNVFAYRDYHGCDTV